MSPSHSVFADILDPMLDRGAHMLDPGRFTADYEASLAFPALPFLTLRIAGHGDPAFRRKILPLLGAPRARRLLPPRLQLGALGEPRYYHGLTFPMVLYACDLIP